MTRIAFVIILSPNPPANFSGRTYSEMAKLLLRTVADLVIPVKADNTIKLVMSVVSARAARLISSPIVPKRKTTLEGTCSFSVANGSRSLDSKSAEATIDMQRAVSDFVRCTEFCGKIEFFLVRNVRRKQKENEPAKSTGTALRS